MSDSCSGFSAAFLLPDIQISFPVSHIGAQSDAGRMPASFDLHGHGVQRKSYGRPWLFYIQTELLKTGRLEEEHFGKAFGGAFQQPEGAGGQEMFYLLADFSVVDGSRQFIRLSGGSRVGV